MRRRSNHYNRLHTLIIAITCGSIASPVVAGEVTLFADDFDAGTSDSQWGAVSHAGDFTTDFAFDYSTRAIPTAPNSTSGSTIGLYWSW